MSRLPDVVSEICNLLLSACANEQLSGLLSPTASMTITLDETASFPAPDGGEVEPSPGVYLVDARADGHLHLISLDYRSNWSIHAWATWHDLNLVSPLALSIPAEKEEQHILVLFPGGGALHSIGASGRTRSSVREHKILPPPFIAEAILKWLPPGILASLPFNKSQLLNPGKVSWGTIEPGPSPTGFGPSSIPPNWIGATVATCYVPPAGSAGWAGPGTEGGVQVFPPGSAVKRGAFPGYLLSVTPVTVTSSLSTAGRVVQLLVTSHVVTIGIPTILSMTWTDVYQVVPAANGPVFFQGVIVATGRVPTSPAAPGTSWPAEVAKRLTGAPGNGAATEFELRVAGITVATRSCKFNARFPGSPALLCQ